MKGATKLKEMLKSWLFWLFAILTWEVVLSVSTSVGFTSFFVFAGISIGAAGLVSCFTGFRGWFGRILTYLVPALFFLIYAVQLVYYQIFDTLLSVSLISMGAEAVTTFWDVLLEALWQTLPNLLFLVVPLVVFYLLQAKKILQPWNWRGRVVQLITSVLLLASLCTYAGNRQINSSIDRWAAKYGLLTAEVLDLEQTITGDTGKLIPNTGSAEHYSADEWNVMEELDFDALQDMTEDEALQEINAYVKSLTPTPKNEYTGMFEGYNLISFCAESFTPYFIDKELTPTLYRMSTEGFVFQNFYNSFPNLTTNGEYCLCMGLMPDFSRMSFSASISNYWPFTLGHAFSDAGIPAFAYHNNVGTFYNRYRTHPNMGYDFRAVNLGLDMSIGRPTSDLEMIEKSIGDYLDKDAFHVYYMTYSGHAPYNFETNEIAIQNQALVSGVAESDTIRSYYAANLELERALTYLIEQLEAAGIADRTVITLTGDHYPYGLPAEDYAHIAADAVNEPFWQYKNSFLCWCPSMEDPVVIEDYCCTQDILPTLLNLFGMPYDSRLLTGRDILADTEHIAIIKDGSFLTEGLCYTSLTDDAAWNTEPDEERLYTLQKSVQDRFAVGSAVLKTNYYGYAFSSMGLYDADEEVQMVPSFSDIEGKWYEEFVEQLTVGGVYQGDGMGLFNGEVAASRSQFVSILCRSLQLPAVDISEPFPYDDIRFGWYIDYLMICHEAGFLPENETQFRPGESITIEEATQILLKAADYLDIPSGEAWMQQNISEVMELQAENSPDFPQNLISRGALAALMVRMIEELGLS